MGERYGPLGLALDEVREWLEVDLSGRPLATGGASASLQGWGPAAAAAVHQLAAAGEALGVGSLRVALVKGPSAARVAAGGPQSLLLGLLEPAAKGEKVQQALCDWSLAAHAGVLPHAPRAEGAQAAAPPPGADAAHAAAQAPAAPEPEPLPPDGEQALLPASEAFPEPVPADPWARLRRALVRGLLADAAVQWRGLAEAWPAEHGGSALPEEHERGVQVLLEGSGAVLAGDGVGGGLLLRGLASLARDQPTLQWLGRLWSARAAQRSGRLASAVAHAQAAQRLSQGLDEEARAASLLCAAELGDLASGDPAASLAALGEALEIFVRSADSWGQSRSLLVQARVLAALGRKEESVTSARRALFADPGWLDPAVFLARRALQDGALDEAERMLAPLRSPDAERELQIVARIREGAISAQDAALFLREQDAAPGPRAVEAMQAFAARWPQFHPAREALGWSLLEIGRYAEAKAVLRELLDLPLPACELARVRLGLGCIANALKRGKPEARLRAAVGDPRRDSGPYPALQPLPGAPPGPAGAARTVFSGYLGVFALPDVLEFLRSGRRTGLLVCSSPAGMGALRFVDGLLTGGAAPGIATLGELLLQAGALDGAALEAASAMHEPDRSDPMLGEVLVREGVVSAEAVQAAAGAQIRAAVRALIAWTDGQFVFDREEQAEGSGPATSVSLDPQGLLLDLFRERDEESRGEAAQ